MSLLSSYLLEADFRGETLDSHTNGSVTYLDTIDPIGFADNGSSGRLYLVSSNALFGTSVALSDDGLTMIVGSPGFNTNYTYQNAYSGGSITAFTRSNISSSWTVFGTANITYTGTGSSVMDVASGNNGSHASYNFAQLGCRVAISGDGQTAVACMPTLFNVNSTPPGLPNIVNPSSLSVNRLGGVAVYTRTVNGFVAAPTAVIQPTVQNTNEYVSWAAISPHGEVIVVGSLFGIYVYVLLANSTYSRLYTTYLQGSGSQVIGPACDVTAISSSGATACTIVVGAPSLNSNQGGVYVFHVPMADYISALAGTPVVASSSSVSTPTQLVPSQTTTAALFVALTGQSLPSSNFYVGASVTISRDGSTIVASSRNTTSTTNSNAPQYNAVFVYNTSSSAYASGAASEVFAQPNYVTNSAAAYAPSTSNGVQGFGAQVVCSGDGGVIVASCFDPISVYNSGFSSQNAAYVFVYVRSASGAHQQVAGVNSTSMSLSSSITATNVPSNGSGGSTSWTAAFTACNGSNFNVVRRGVSAAINTTGTTIVLGDPNFASQTVQNGGDPSNTGFQEGVVLSFQLRQAYPQILALEDEVGAACDNDYNDLIVRTGFNPLYPLQTTLSTSGPTFFEIVFDFLRLSSSNPVSVYVVFDNLLFSNIISGSNFQGWSIAYYYEGALVGTTLATGTLKSGQLSGLGLAANYGATFDGSNVVQLYSNTAACIPSAFQASRTSYYSNWQSAGTTPYAATVVLKAPIASNPDTGLGPVTNSPPFVLVFGCTHKDGSLGYVAPQALISDPTNTQVTAYESETGVTTILKVALDNTPIPSAANGTFTPTQEFVPLIDVYPGASTGQNNAYKMATGSGPLDFSDNISDTGLRLPAVAASASWTSVTANWSFATSTQAKFSV